MWHNCGKLYIQGIGGMLVNYSGLQNSTKTKKINFAQKCVKKHLFLSESVNKLPKKVLIKK